MKDLVAAFPSQLTEALKIARETQLRSATNPIHHVLICGLGGSGIGGTIVSELAFDAAPVPVTVSKGYFIPAFVGQNTLVIVSSYSGNTEETLACMDQALSRKAQIICISSGGIVAEKASSNNLDLLLVPGGMPPRACLGYSLVQLLAVFAHHGLLPTSVLTETELSIQLLIERQEAIQSEARKVAAFLQEKVPVIYCTSGNEGLAIRFRQQLNENAKVLCWHQVVPEMNHNELVGWANTDDRIAVVFLRDPDEYERNDYRIALNKDVITKYTPHLLDVFAQGKTRIEKMFWHIHLGDWASCFLADARGVDAVEVNVIHQLKNNLAKKS